MLTPLRPHHPRRLGPYRLLARLGGGGMGEVFLAMAPDGAQVALKAVRREFAWDEQFRARFRGEVLRARQVPAFCTAEVLDADPEHDPPYLVAEYVDRPSLAQAVADHGRLPPNRLHGTAIGLAMALAAVHGAGVVHCDVKPSNILLAPGAVKVIDFGIAQALPAPGQQSGVGLVGTVSYMAPERFQGPESRPVTAAADIFSWGAVMAYAATGRTPFDAGSAPATAVRILTRPPDLAGVPAGLRGLVTDALAKDPGDRPSARELVEALIYPPAQPTGEPPLVVGAGSLQAAAALPMMRRYRAPRRPAPAC